MNEFRIGTHLLEHCLYLPQIELYHLSLKKNRFSFPKTFDECRVIDLATGGQYTKRDLEMWVLGAGYFLQDTSSLERYRGLISV